ncbi:DNA polymerase II large subunit [Methanimicrococcus blatticola]|uniref:DNA polymerase II large subunit n=1 Tax=Methanimicrococcus blatticola TaxID=91560 RepID=A0A484F3C2_9EURY|nr:DNA polymerase II large subunit [Methanimicrococcus blatticola]MBZ3936399.1 DNA polymerase II large subunit [Methanimicrococcus blatticola]MCC2509561.1 DNA polymerase II large subunit [Methanimicrococcus blatticola]TDQ67611.1 DNA polymerase II large subunit [Methanimicrococcus blatticola]
MEKKPAQSEAMQKYFDSLEAKLFTEMEIANAARSKGEDPHPYVEIPLAKDLADRVENLIGVKGVAKRLREIEEEGKNREESALLIAKEIAEGKVGGFTTREQSVDAAIRVSMAVITEGVVAAPIEGIAEVKIDKNSDGTEFLRIYYSGPIRSAGGTAQALSVLVGDYVRRSLGLDRFKPRKELVERYAEEIRIYKRTASLQYSPTDDEIRLIVENCPVCVDGDATEEAEVEGYRNMPEIPGNRLRGGMALVIAEGMILKAPKVKKHVDNLSMDGWEFLDKLIAGTKTEDKKGDDTPAASGKPGAVTLKIKPKTKYIQDLIAGRPLFSHPSREGGFRLRYGRSRNTSFAAAGISPAGMFILDDFITNGTQLKVERPGKAAGMAAVDSIEGPTVRLKNGDVVRADDGKTALQIKPDIEFIIDIGEILFNYGDFLENNHQLMPSPYCFEWWLYDYENGYNRLKEEKKVDISRFPNPDDVEKLKHVSEEEALLFADAGIPLHPDYNYLWHDLYLEELEKIADFIAENGKLEDYEYETESVSCLSLPYEKSVDDGIKPLLENILILHKVREIDGEKRILIAPPTHVLRCLSVTVEKDKSFKKAWTSEEIKSAGIELTIDAVSKISNMTVKARAPSRIGARMGRPEKSALRKMSPAAQVLFPIGEHGGKTRNLVNASEYREDMNATTGKFEIKIGMRVCPRCGRETHKWRCGCGEFTIERLFCPRCGIETSDSKCPKCEKPTMGGRKKAIEFRPIYKEAIERLGVRDNFDLIKGVKELMSRAKTPEPLEKGILRALHDVYIFKDGTARYDMSDIPLTHIRADELGITAEDLKKLGYEKDIYGKDLELDDQVVCLFVQDLIISVDCAEYLLKTTQYIDDLLKKYYGVDPYYNCKTIKDLLGVMVIGLAPHTSAGVLGRLAGFTKASVGFAHPYFHASKRRNCDGDEDCVMLLLDGMLNFSREYLPDKRGGQMDAPLVLTIRIDPNEIDKEAHNIDMCARYPHAFYLATEEYKNPAEISKIMDLVSSRLKTPDQYENFMFTHGTTNIASGPAFSAYKTLETMTDKMEAQLQLAEKIRAVDESNVAELVLKSHFLPDIMGNLRAFSKQTFRCIKCEAKYRRPPLTGTCPKCGGGNIILTVHEGAVRKYVEVSKEVAIKYHVSEYTLERIELLEQDIIQTFENHKIKKTSLTDFM